MVPRARRIVRRLSPLGLLTLVLTAAPAAAQRGAAPSPEIPSSAGPWATLRFRYIGPVGNRVSAVAGVPGDPSTYYVGAASGGIWKTTDAGVHWTPIFDDQPVQSIGALAVASSDPNVIWAGTGEAWIRSHISIGNGIYRSLDGGKSWQHMGLDATGRIGKVLIDPTNPDIVFACALGAAYGPQPDRGVYRTTDGGRSWQKVLSVDANTGCGDMTMDPTNPHILFAGMWQLVIHTWGRESGGPGSAIYVSRDGGSTWTKLVGHGLPTHVIGKSSIAIARSNPNRVYALIETGEGEPFHGQPTDRGDLWRSEDGGESWHVVSYDRQLGGRKPYYNRVTVSPDNENEAYFTSASFTKTLDGGVTSIDVPFQQAPGGDNHDMWIDPTNGNRLVVGNDQEVSISINRGRSWQRVQLPIAQMYHAEVDNEVPYNVYGNRQDGPSFRVPSNSRTGGFGGGGIPRGDTHAVGGGESGWATPDTVQPGVVWSTASGSGMRGGIVVRYDEKTRQDRNVEVWPLSTGGWPADSLKYRFVWDAPFAISPHDHNRIYVGSQYVHESTDGGESWHVISPDLTLNEKSRQTISGGLTPDNIGVEYGDVVYAIAESPLTAGLLWVGTNDGQVQLTRDGGKSWTNVTKALPGLPAWVTISSIQPSHDDAGTAYLTADGHQVDNRDPWVYRTTDYGKTWKLITTGLPKVPNGYAHVIREDLVRRGLLYLGTEGGLYVSFDDGAAWQPLQNNLPHAPVYGLALQPHFDDLVVATYGRGFWILDDLGPLQQRLEATTSPDVQLFKPRDAWRFRTMTSPGAVSDDPTAGQNPAYGATVDYWLRAEQESAPRLEILDAAGKVVRTLTGTKRAGLNRVMWDLRNEPTPEVRLFMSPLNAPELRAGPEGRPAPDVERMSVLMPPGTYTVKLTVAGQEQSQPLTVRKDPNTPSTEAELARQTTLMLDLQQDLATCAAMISSIESLRSQAAGFNRTLARVNGGRAGAAKAAPGVPEAAEALDAKLAEVEGLLTNARLTGRGQDVVRWPVRLAGQITYLAGGVAEADFAPTTQQLAVRDLLHARVQAARAQLDALVAGDVAKFNDLVRQKSVPTILVK